MKKSIYSMIAALLATAFLSCNKGKVPSAYMDMQTDTAAVTVSSLAAQSRTSVSLNRVMSAEEYIDVITGFTCEKAELTDNGYLVIGINAISGADYDGLAEQFLSETISEGVGGVKGVLIVDIKTARFQKGAVIGDRIGRAYK